MVEKICLPNGTRAAVGGAGGGEETESRTKDSSQHLPVLTFFFQLGLISQAPRTSLKALPTIDLSQAVILLGYIWFPNHNTYSPFCRMAELIHLANAFALRSQFMWHTLGKSLSFPLFPAVVKFCFCAAITHLHVSIMASTFIMRSSVPSLLSLVPTMGPQDQENKGKGILCNKYTNSVTKGAIQILKRHDWSRKMRQTFSEGVTTHQGQVLFQVLLAHHHKPVKQILTLFLNLKYHDLQKAVCPQLTLMFQ